MSRTILGGTRSSRDGGGRGRPEGSHSHEPVVSILLWHFYMVIFDPLVYPMDTAWLDGKIPADHYRHSRPGYMRALRRAGLVTPVGDEAPPQVNYEPAIKPESTEKSRSSLPRESS